MSHQRRCEQHQSDRDCECSDDLRAAKMNTAADLVERSVSETLTYYAFPDIHWQKIRTTDEIDKRLFVN